MTRALILLSLLAGCSSIIEQGDAYQVSIGNSEFDTYAGLYQKAAWHCGLYRKTAVLQGRYDSYTTIFRCV